MQGGAGLEEIAASISACVLCGSCEPVCSYGVESVMRTIEMRAALRDMDSTIKTEAAPSRARGRVLLANTFLMAEHDMLEQVLRQLGSGVALHPDSGNDISEAMETGVTLEVERVTAFMESLRGASEVITTDGLIYRLIRRLAPEINMVSLGQALLNIPSIRNSLGPDDLYVIDATTYNAGYGSMVSFYDGIRRASGTMMNLDLHRVATPTGAMQHASGGIVDPVSQARWILKGRPASRIIVERLNDLEPFRAVTDAPVVFVAELSGKVV